AKHDLVQCRAGVVLGQHALERLVVFLDGAHGIVNQRADLGALGVSLQVRPAAFFGYPENVVGETFVLVLGGFGAFCQQLCMASFEGIGNVLEKDQAQGDVLVVAGLHAAAQFVGGFEQFGFKAKAGTAVGGFFCV